MTEQEAFHKAAQDAGYESWGHAKILGPAHANEILARHKAEQALADYKAEVSKKADTAAEALQNLIALARPHFSDISQILALAEAGYARAKLIPLIIPTPDPLVEAKNAAIRDAERDFRSANLVPKTLSECLDRAFAKHGLKLERIDQ